MSSEIQRLQKELRNWRYDANNSKIPLILESSIFAAELNPGRTRYAYRSPTMVLTWRPTRNSFVGVKSSRMTPLKSIRYSTFSPSLRRPSKAEI